MLSAFRNAFKIPDLRKKIIFTLVVPLASLGLCLAISMATSGRNGPPSPPIR